MSPVQQVGCFVSGLKDNIRTDVQACCPFTHSVAIGLERLFEYRNLNNRRASNNEIRWPTFNTVTVPNQNYSPMTVKRLKPAELKERRDKGLCFNCDEKFSPGYRCKKLFFIEGHWLDEENDVAVDESGEVTVIGALPEVSLHAIYGSRAPQTMKVKGKVGDHECIFLVDSGSTHNFLSNKVADRMGIDSNEEEQFEVVIANGERISSAGLCKSVRMIIQGIPILVDLYMLPL